MQPLLGALAKADKDSRQKFLEALRDGVGGKGLVLALQSVDKSKRDTEKFQTKLIFDMLRSLEDPRSADALAAYIATNPPPHWKTEAGLRLAEIGDLRAVPTLAWRMKQDPLNLYNKDLDPDYRQDDNERVVSARMLADLAVVNPDKRADIRAEAYDGVYFWMTNKPQPHANALRFMAAAEAKEALPKMRTLGEPERRPSRRKGSRSFPPVWATAQSALRYVGWMQDPQSWGTLEAQLRRKPEKVDATMEALLQGGMAVMGMSLRAIGVGASHGFAQWGDAKAYPILVKYIEDKQNNEQSRIEACFSLGWVATDEQMKRGREEGDGVRQARPEDAAHSRLLPRVARSQAASGGDGGARRPHQRHARPRGAAPGGARDRLRRHDAGDHDAALREAEEPGDAHRRGARDPARWRHGLASAA